MTPLFLQISPRGKAGEAGIKEKDIILAVDGRKVNAVDDLKISLLNKSPGDRVTLKIFRQRDLLPDQTLEIEVELSGVVLTSATCWVSPYSQEYRNV